MYSGPNICKAAGRNYPFRDLDSVCNHHRRGQSTICSSQFPKHNEKGLFLAQAEATLHQTLWIISEGEGTLRTTIETYTIKHLNAQPSLCMIQVRDKGSAFLLHNNFRQGPDSFCFVTLAGYDDIPQELIILGHGLCEEWEG